MRVHGDLPRPRWLRGFHLPLAIMRSLWLAMCLLVRHFLLRERYDVFVVDQLSVPIPLLRLTGAPVSWQSSDGFVYRIDSPGRFSSTDTIRTCCCRPDESVRG